MEKLNQFYLDTINGTLTVNGKLKEYVSAFTLEYKIGKYFLTITSDELYSGELPERRDSPNRGSVKNGLKNR